MVVASVTRDGACAGTGFGSCKTLLLASRKNCRVIELSSISSKTVELSNYRVYRAKLSSYRTIEYIEQNCRVIELSSISSKTVELLVYSSARQFLWDFAVHAQYAQ